MVFNICICILIFTFVCVIVCASNEHNQAACTNLYFSIKETILNDGFHREIEWLITNKDPKNSPPNCEYALSQNISKGMFVDPDEISNLSRQNNIDVLIDGKVNIESAAHDASSHTLYVFLPKSTNLKTCSIKLPVHLRYQRAQISGIYSAVPMERAVLLAKCKLKSLCGKQIKSPCSQRNESCHWTAIAYESIPVNNILQVPVGNLNDYPIVSITSLLLGCCGCIYILSLLSTSQF